MTKSPEVHLLLDNIRSVHNVGSIFRTAETIGITRIYCAGTTPVPVDRFGRKRRDFAKVALGAEDMVPWEHTDDAVAVAKSLNKEGFDIICLEQAADSVDYKTVKLRCNTLVIVGSEVAGVSGDLLRLAQTIAEIPKRGRKESLNVSVATGIFLYRLLDN